MKVDVQFAASHFADIVAAASRGEEVEIELGEKPSLLLAPKRRIAQSGPRVKCRKDLLGAGEGLMALPTDEEWREMDKEIELEMLGEAPAAAGRV